MMELQSFTFLLRVLHSLITNATVTALSESFAVAALAREKTLVPPVWVTDTVTYVRMV